MESVGLKSQTSIAPGRDNNFFIIRFCSALLVIYDHMFTLVRADNQPMFMGRNIAAIGFYSFFLLSGYLVSQSYQSDPNVLRYAIRRSFRIMPGLIVLILITVYIIGPIFTTVPLPEYFSSYLINEYLQCILLKIYYTLPGVFFQNPYPTAVNGSLWSLTVEMMLYVTIPLLIVLFKKINIRVPVVAGIIIFLIAFGYYVSQTALGEIVFYQIGLYSALRVAPYFFIGYLFTLPKIKKILNLQVAFFMFLFLVYFQFPKGMNDFMILLFLPYIVFSVALAPKPIFKNFGLKNDYSYGLFLYSFLVQQMVINIISVRMNLIIPFYAYLVLSFGLSFLFAFFSWHCVEKPIQRLGKKLCSKLKSLGADPIKQTELRKDSGV